MSFASAIDSSSLSVLLDVRSPHCYLALQPAAALGRELGITINWLPLPVPPLSPPSSPAAGDDRGIRHRRHRAHAIAREVETYAAIQGLVLGDLYRDPDPAALNLGWLWMRERKPERLESFLVEAFRAYWALELDPTSEPDVAALVAAVEADASEFAAWCGDDGAASAALLADELRERGLFGVPGYVVEQEFFQGRQHLPMIRWILAGRSGPLPI